MALEKTSTDKHPSQSTDEKHIDKKQTTQTCGYPHGGIPADARPAEPSPDGIGAAVYFAGIMKPSPS
jgi:hypothetical protein